MFQNGCITYLDSGELSTQLYCLYDKVVKIEFICIYFNMFILYIYRNRSNALWLYIHRWIVCAENPFYVVVFDKNLKFSNEKFFIVKIMIIFVLLSFLRFQKFELKKSINFNIKIFDSFDDWWVLWKHKKKASIANLFESKDKKKKESKRVIFWNIKINFYINNFHS